MAGSGRNIYRNIEIYGNSLLNSYVGLSWKLMIL